MRVSCFVPLLNYSRMMSRSVDIFVDCKKLSTALIDHSCLEQVIHLSLFN
jgi:hypothetical protein